MLIDFTKEELQFIEAAIQDSSGRPGNFYLPGSDDPETTVGEKIYEALKKPEEKP